jgi:hypothetical protein
MKKIIVILSILFLSVTAYGKARYFIPSDIGTSAQMIRLGNIEGFSHTASSVFENPAALYRISRLSGSMFTTTMMDEVLYQNLALAVRTDYGVFGFGYMSAGVDDIFSTAMNPETEEFYSIGTFKYENMMAKLAYQFSQNEHLHFGLGGTFFKTEMDTIKGTGYNFDAGVVLDFDDLQVSYVVRNISQGMAVDYIDEDVATYNGQEEIPLQTALSIKYRIGDFNIFSQFKQIGNNSSLMKSFGLNYRPSFVPYINISAGIKEFLVLDQVHNNTVLGVGLDLFGINFDYAYESSEHIQFNHKHYFSVAVSF